MRASFAAEVVKLGKRPSTWLIAAVWLVLGLVFGYLFPYLSYRGAAGGVTGIPPQQILAQALPGNLVPTAIQGFPLFSGALALIVGVLSSGSEYGWGTLKTVLTQRPRRAAVCGGKLLALGLVMLLLVVATFALDALASWVIPAAESQPLSWPSATTLAQGFGAGYLIIAMWCAGGMFLGILLQGTALAIGLGLVWALVVESLVRGFASLLGVIDTVQRLMPGTNAGSLVGALGGSVESNSQGTPGVTNVVSGTHAALVVGLYVAVFVALAVAVLQKRDVT